MRKEKIMQSKRLQKAAEIAKSTMTGDLRDVLLDIIRDKNLTGKAWKDMNEDEQRRTRDMIVARIEPAVGRAVDIIASEGRKHVKVLLKQVTIKDGIKGVFEAPKAVDLRYELIDAQGDTCLLVLTGSDKYKGEKGPVKIDKDQPDLIEKNKQDQEKQPDEKTAHDPETGEVIEDNEIETDEGDLEDDDDTDGDFEDIEDDE